MALLTILALMPGITLTYQPLNLCFTSSDKWSGRGLGRFDEYMASGCPKPQYGVEVPVTGEELTAVGDMLPEGEPAYEIFPNRTVACERALLLEPPSDWPCCPQSEWACWDE